VRYPTSGAANVNALLSATASLSKTSGQIKRRIDMEILRDRNGKPQGVIREIAGGQQRLYDRAGNAIASHRPRTGYTTTTMDIESDLATACLG